MPAYSSIDRETLSWVKTEVASTLEESRQALNDLRSAKQLEANEGVTDKKQLVKPILNQLHQVDGSLQMLELRSLSSLASEAERLVEEFIQEQSAVSQSAFLVLMDSSLDAIEEALQRIEQGRPENPITLVELINQLRAVRGLDEVEISSMFSPDIDVFPELPAHRVLQDDEYRARAKTLRGVFQVQLIRWLRDDDEAALQSIRTVVEKLLGMSTFGAVARLWWVSLAYLDFVTHNRLHNRAVHGRIFRGIDDLLRKLQQQGEPALVRDPGEEVIKIMLFYTGAGQDRTEHMDEIAQAFSLDAYFPELEYLNEVRDFTQIQAEIDQLRSSADLPLPQLRKLVTEYFEVEGDTTEGLADMVRQMQAIDQLFAEADIEILSPLVAEAMEAIRGLRSGAVPRDDDTGFHLASSIIFVENSIAGSEEVDEHWVNNGELRIKALQAINSQEQVAAEFDGTHITGSERKALLDVVGAEVEGSLRDIEERLELFGLEPENSSHLDGIAQQVRHVRGALQVLGEQKVGLLLQMAESEFSALQQGHKAPTPALVDALALSVGTMEEYVKGLQRGRGGMDDLLDRSISDLEVAIGKRVSRGDVETLLENSSDALFSWLGEQSDFALFTSLKSYLRDLRSLARKTRLEHVEELIGEQNRLIDVISQEPAFLTENIIANLQNNMANIAGEVIQLYGTEESPEEIEDAEQQDTAQQTLIVDESEQKIFDEMDIEDAGVEAPDDEDGDQALSATDIGRQHAAQAPAGAASEDPIFQVFLEESTEVVAEARDLHKVCTEHPEQRDAIRELRRAFHTLKGSSRMVGLEQIGEVAWFAESLFNYVLDTEKPLTKSILAFSDDALNEFSQHINHQYAEQHLIDVGAWGEKTEQVKLDEQVIVQDSETAQSEEATPATQEAISEEEAFSEGEKAFSEGETLSEGEEALSEGEETLSEEEALGEGEEASTERESLAATDTEAVAVDGEQFVGDIEISSDLELDSELELEAFPEQGSESSDTLEYIEPEEDSAEITFIEEQDASDEVVWDPEDDLEGELEPFVSTDSEATIELESESTVELESESTLDVFSETSISFSVMEDQEMREVFVAEAQKHLGLMSEALARDSLILEEDDAFSIAVHTLLGNARTLGLSRVADAFAQAEQICEFRQESDEALSQVEHSALSGLLAATHKVIQSSQPEAPYFFFADDEWDDLGFRLDTAVESLGEATLDTNTEIELDSINDIELELSEPIFELEKDVVESSELTEESAQSADEEIAQSADEEIAQSADEEIAQSADEVDSSDPSIAKVNAVFKGLEPIDDLLQPEPKFPQDGPSKSAEESDSHSVADDLDEFSNSLAAFKQSSAEPSAEPSVVDDEASEHAGSSAHQSDQATEQGEAERQSLIPDELTNLLQEDLLNLGSALEPLTPADAEHYEADGQTAAEASEIQAKSEPSSAANAEADADADADESAIGTESHADQTAEQIEPLPELPEESIQLDAEDATPTATDTEFTSIEEQEPSAASVSEPEIEPSAASSGEQDKEPSAASSSEQDKEPSAASSSEQDKEPSAASSSEQDKEPSAASSGEPDGEADADADADVDVDGVDVDEDLREIFLVEVRNIQNELDSEVAKLTELRATPEAMANIMRYLHTVKGSSMMAEAITLGELTHQTESYLEGNFIHNDDELKEVRTTLELYVDNLDLAADAYQEKQPFLAARALRDRLGIAETILAPEDIAPEAQPDQGDLTSFDISEALAAMANRGTDLFKHWKSARSWNKTQSGLLEEYSELLTLVSEAPQLAELKPFADTTFAYVQKLEVPNKDVFKPQKALLQESFDATITKAYALSAGDAGEDLSQLQQQLDSTAGGGLSTDSNGSDTAIFVPGAVEVDTLEQADQARRRKAASERAAAMRIRTETLDSLTNFVGDASMNRSQMREDVLGVKGTVDGLYENVRRFTQQLRELEIEADVKISSRSKDASGVDRAAEFDPLEMDRYTRLQQLSRGLAENLDELSNIQTSLSNFVYRAETSLQKQDRLNRELQDEIMQVRLVSFGGIGPQLRQVVRRTARELGKEVELEIVGADVRLDKAILDGVVPALEHMLRNAVDHGIELPEQREQSNKSVTGKIIVECRQVAREIVISVRDDGAGLDLEKIRRKAVEDNLLAPDQALNPENALVYISQSGFSTAAELTQISGRGVGMDVVQSTLRRLSGSIAYDHVEGQVGSSFTIRLPISLAVTSAVFITASGEQFAVASRTIERVVNIEATELAANLQNEQPMLKVDGQDYTLIDLADYLGYPSHVAAATGKLPVIVVNAGVQNIAVVVDEILDTQEIVVKNLGEHLGRIPIYAGATIRADGRVVLLIDLVGISYYESFISLPEAGDELIQDVPTVMVVDDSLTVRKSAERDISGLGITAILAKDGLDAQEQLRQSIPDMILLDIEMPRMDGFELLEWVRTEQRTKEIPVVMISSRATEKHIQKATELGCSAFLGKPYLLESLVNVFNQYLPLPAPIELDKN